MDFESIRMALAGGHRRLQAVLLMSQTETCGQFADFSYRDESNALVAQVFRNGHLEELHRGVTGFSDQAMKKLMVESAANLAGLLYLRDRERAAYDMLTIGLSITWCREWDRSALTHDEATEDRRKCPHCSESVRAVWRFCAMCGRAIGEWAEIPQVLSNGTKN
jgi:hypothetical protein